MLQILFHLQSATILFLLYVGVWKRRQRATHVKIMKVSIIWDLLLVLQIELSRGAVEKAVKVVENPWILNYHVTVAVLVLVGYAFVFRWGRRLLRGDESVRSRHRAAGVITLLLRTSTWATSFLV